MKTYHQQYSTKPRHSRALTVAIAATLGLALAKYGHAADLYISGELGLSASHATLKPEPSDTPYIPASEVPFVTTGSKKPFARGAIGLSFGRMDVELGFGSLGRYAQSRFKGTAKYGESADVSGYEQVNREVDVRARYNQPIVGRLSAYVEGGLAHAMWNAEHWSYTADGWVSQKGTANVPQLGAGLGYDVDKHLKLTIGVTETPNVNGVHFTQVYGGLRFAF